MTRVAAVQMSSTDNKVQNLEKVERFTAIAASEGCRLVAFPEMFNCMAGKGCKLAQAEDLTGETVQLMKKLAQQHRLYILAGSMLFAEPGDALPQNLSLLYSPAGDIILRYAKIHLFDVDIPGKVSYRESTYTKSGNFAEVVDTDIGAIATTICYDLRFTELYNFLRGKNADIIAVPAAFTYKTGQDHWEILLRARAIENQVFIIAPNQCGKLVNGIECYGNTMICDPWGTILARAGDHEEEIVFASLDFVRLRAIREEMPMAMHQRRFNRSS